MRATRKLLEPLSDPVRCRAANRHEKTGTGPSRDVGSFVPLRDIAPPFDEGDGPMLRSLCLPFPY